MTTLPPSYAATCAGVPIATLIPLAATRVQIELWVRWMRETRGLRPATVSRRVLVTAGIYRTCVIETILERSPAEFVSRPRVPAESPTLGFTRPQFEALPAAGRDSANRHDFALVAMLRLLGLRIFEACSADVSTSARNTGASRCAFAARADKVVHVSLPPAVKRAIDRAVDGRLGLPILRSRTGTRMDRRCHHPATTPPGRNPPASR